MELSDKEFNRLCDESFWEGAAVGAVFVGVLWGTAWIWQMLAAG